MLENKYRNTNGPKKLSLWATIIYTTQVIVGKQY